MGFARRLVVGLAALVLAVMTVGFLLPDTVVMSRTVVITAPPESVFPYINSMRRSVDWSPLRLADPAVQVAFRGPESGVGSRLDWASEDFRLRSGSQRILVSDPPRHVRSTLAFAGLGSAMASFDLVPRGDATALTLGLEADMGNGPLARWAGLLLHKWIGANYARGLDELKALLEAGEG